MVSVTLAEVILINEFVFRPQFDCVVEYEVGNSKTDVAKFCVQLVPEFLLPISMVLLLLI